MGITETKLDDEPEWLADRVIERMRDAGFSIRPINEREG